MREKFTKKRENDQRTTTNVTHGKEKPLPKMGIQTEKAELAVHLLVRTEEEIRESDISVYSLTYMQKNKKLY